MDHDWLAAAIASRRPFRFGELEVSFNGNQAAVEVPGDGGEMTDVSANPAAVREWTRLDVHGRYRPLSGARGIRRGWQVRCSLEDLSAILDAVYPLAPRHIAMAAEGRLRIEPLDAVLGRQSGRYRAARDTPPQIREAARDVLCGTCVRTPWWDGEPAGLEGDIPCPEPCSVFVSLCRDLTVLGGTPEPVDPDPAVPFATFEEPGNEIRERCLERIRRG